MVDEELEFQISRYLDDDLSPPETRALEERLAADAGARAVLADYRRLSATLSTGSDLPQTSHTALLAALGPRLDAADTAAAAGLYLAADDDGFDFAADDADPYDDGTQQAERERLLIRPKPHRGVGLSGQGLGFWRYAAAAAVLLTALGGAVLLLPDGAREASPGIPGIDGGIGGGIASNTATTDETANVIGGRGVSVGLAVAPIPARGTLTVELARPEGLAFERSLLLDETAIIEGESQVDVGAAGPNRGGWISFY
ncbi:MAG: anti-sigma factor family protein [Phycisphaerae bacterium]